MDLNILPERWRPYAKAVVSFIPVVAFGLTALVQALTTEGVVVPTWLAVVVTFFVSLGVYEIPNEPTRPDGHDVA